VIFGFSEYSLRLEALEIWEDVLDVVSALADADAAAAEEEEASPAEAAAQDDGAHSAVLDAAVEYADSHWAEDDAEQASDLASLVPSSGIASIEEPNASAMIAAQRTAIRRTFKGYDWVFRYEAIPGPSMTWQHLFDARQDDDRQERERRAAVRNAPTAPTMDTSEITNARPSGRVAQT
jgi:hypothetical protein